MAETVKLRWAPTMSSGLPRSARRGCEYEAYLPDALSGRDISLTSETAADISDAERAVDRLNAEVRALGDSEAIARLLLRAEAVASSKIEGLEIGGRRLLKAQVASGLADPDAGDVRAVEVLNNIEAMRWAIDAVSGAEEITVDHITGIHERLLAGTALDRHAGRLRDEQNWIGGSSYNPCAAAFVPPPPTHVRPLLEDLCRFCNDDAPSPVAQAALAHAQFETIHPFVDGNGRTGRALIHVVLRRRGLAPTVVPPISLVLATWSDDYVAGLTATRYLGPASAAPAVQGVNGWLALFAAATQRSVKDAETFEDRVQEIQSRWRSRLGRLRKDSAAAKLVEALPGAPVITVQTAAALIGRSEQAVNEAIPRLVQAGVLKQISVVRRNRAFEATELVDAFTDLERQLASPDGDTRWSLPRRRVPASPA